jgi:serine/threonine-protein kinase
VTKPATQDPKLGLLLLGRYRIVQKLGEGGMGAVYEGQHELIGKRLAIKCLHAQFATNPEIVERFYREAQSATAVGNEHIIEVTDVGTFDDGAPFIVMEFLEGIELAKLIEQEGSLSISRLVHIVTQVCGALSAAHARGIVHRDMKPENIYLIRRGADSDFVKVLDFGVSKVRDASDSMGAHALTRTGMAIGTPYYMPPEQAQGVRDLDHRADIYAVGVILYQGLTGHLPFDAESYPALLLKIVSERPAPLRVFRNDLPEALESLVLKAMARDRSDRFQTTQELADALQRFSVLQTMPPESMSRRSAVSAIPQTTPFVTAHDQPMTREPSSLPTAPGASRPWLVPAAIGAVAITGVVVWLARGKPEPTESLLRPAAVVSQAAVVPGVPAEPVVARAAEPQQRPEEAVPREVQVKISVTPSDARIFIGDQEFPNPMDAFRPRSLDPIRIRVEAKGHETVEQLAIFDQSRQLSFSLAQGRGVRRLDATGAPQAAAPRPAPDKPVEVKPEPAPEPTPAAPPAADGVYRGPTGKLRDEL